LAGKGIAYKSWLDVYHDVTAGRLEVLIPDQPGESSPLNMVCPHRRQFTPAVRYLHSELRERTVAMTATMREHTEFREP
jgi:DNA-binding transcriptional LysR family regulator